MTADKIDELARTVAPYRPPSSRVEAVRSNLLVSANFIPTRPRVMTKPIALAASLMIAAAALFWLATRTESATHFAVVRSTGSASYAWPASPPDERLTLADGAVSITVVPRAGVRYVSKTAGLSVDAILAHLHETHASAPALSGDHR